MSAKSLPEHLLEQARHLAQRDRTRPKQASLRRALSTACYAFFHFLIREAIQQIAPNFSEDNYNRAYRWFEHGTMSSAARAFSQEVVRIPKSKDVLIQKNDSGVIFIAENFADLQDLRHLADYDPSAVFLRAEVLDKICHIEDAFALWKSGKIKKSPEANTFLLSLLLWEKWGKQR
jgi:hypothetical protein